MSTDETGAIDLSAAELESTPLSVDDRKRVLSAVRLKLTLTVFVIAVLLVFSAVIYLGVSRIFDWLTPSIRHDLERKAQRGALELAQSAQFGIVVADRAAISAAAADYIDDGDVISLLVLDREGKRLFQHGGRRPELSRAFAGARGRAHDVGAAYVAWAPSVIEGVEVGRVALLVSKARLEAGEHLRREILTAAGLVCLLALAVCLLFVNLYIGPILRVTGEAFARLERTTEAALQAARLKSQFLANMSHEIRTPMNGIIGVLDLINRTALTPKQQRYTQTIENSARGLLTIIDDILDFSKLEAGKYVFRESELEVRAMTQDLVELLAPRAHSKGIELVQRVDPDVPHSVRGDVDRVKQVITNLLGNAIKFTDRGHVLLHVASQSTPDGRPQLRFTVTDTGSGIAAEDQAKLFGVFSQVDGSLTRKHGGTGLGLAICKRLVEGMGGQIGVESQPGRGSTFWFTIDAREGQLRAGDGPSPRDARVLVVAKDEAQRDTMCELVARWGMRCTGTDTPERAAALIVDDDASPFDLAVVDCGFDETEEGNRMLFDLCLAEGLPLIRLLSTVQTAELGEHDHALCLTKPVRVSELYNGIIALLDGVPLVQQRRWGRTAPEGDDAGRTGPARGRVLVVDDNEINRLVAIELLGELGYSSDAACNGVEAVEKAARGGYGAILMDCQMPEMDGYEATRRIRALPGPEAKVPIIALTAHAMAGDRDRVLRAGMDDYTPKPVRARVLERMLQRWIPPASGEPVASGAASVHGAPNGQNGSAADHDLDGASSEPVLDPTIPRSPRVVAMFLSAVPEQIAALQQSAEARDHEQARKLAHKLKGSSLSIGAARLAATCAAVERAAAQGEPSAALSRIPDEFAAVARLLTGARTSERAPEANR